MGVPLNISVVILVERGAGRNEHGVVVVWISAYVLYIFVCAVFLWAPEHCVTTGWIFEISLCENSVQFKNIAYSVHLFFMFCVQYHHHNHNVLLYLRGGGRSEVLCTRCMYMNKETQQHISLIQGHNRMQSIIYNMSQCTAISTHRCARVLVGT